MEDQNPASEEDVRSFLAFFERAGKLKDTLRSARTAQGKRESTAEHTWRLCLVALTLKNRFPPGVDFGRLLEILIIHDIGESVTGDIPATEQVCDKTADERIAMEEILGGLPNETASQLLDIWEEYSAVRTPEAQLAKALDRLETVMQHIEGENEPGFDYAFNLTYGHEHTDSNPLVAALREVVDEETRRRARSG
ncbi:HD domain-containing protein [Amaricoccus tamworthensis]|uniref:HD domain-containing protein n=1 Tax=Amaricoccus tamworthensis TaxID=57002 RepID=UPI003C7B7606